MPYVRYVQIRNSALLVGKAEKRARITEHILLFTKLSHLRLSGQVTTSSLFWHFWWERRTTLHVATAKNSVGNKDSYYHTFPAVLSIPVLNRTMNKFVLLRYLFSVLFMQILWMSHRLRGYCHSAIFHSHILVIDRLCGPVVKSSWIQIQKSRRYQIFWGVVSREWDPLSLVRKTGGLLEWKSSGSGSMNRD
jgi:hypothetical protein